MTGGELRRVRTIDECGDGPIAIVVRPFTAESSAFWTTRSDSESSAEVAARVSWVPRAMRRTLVEQQDARSADDGAGNGDALFLTSCAV